MTRKELTDNLSFLSAVKMLESLAAAGVLTNAEKEKARVELNNGLTCLADNDPAQMFEYGDVKQYWGTSHVKQIGNFYQSLLGLAPMYVTAENAFLTQEMICALYEHGRRHFVREVR